MRNRESDALPLETVAVSSPKEDAGRVLMSVHVPWPLTVILVVAGIPIVLTAREIRGNDYSALFGYLEYVFPFYAALIGGHGVYEEKLKKESPEFNGYAVACFKAAVLFLFLGLLAHFGGHFTAAGGELHKVILYVITAILSACGIWGGYKSLDKSCAPFFVPLRIAFFLFLIIVVFPWLLFLSR